MKQSRARWIALLAATAIALYLCWLMLRPFVEVPLWAAVLAIVFWPVHAHIARRTGLQPGWAAGLSCVLVAGAILLPVTVITTAVISEVGQLADYLQANADRLLDPGRNRLLRWLVQYAGLDPVSLQSGKFLADALRAIGGTVASGAVDVVAYAFTVAIKTILVVLTLYYLFRDGERIRVALLAALPLERSQSRQIFDRTREVIGASVYGVLVVATIQAILGGLAFAAVGLPSALLWTVVMFFLSMVPMAGSFLVWVPAALYLGLDGYWGKALLLAAWCAGVVGTIDNVVRPRLVGKKTHMHELLIFFSVLGGLQLFGVLGLVVGPVVVAITLALLDVFRKANRPPSVTLSEPTLAEEQAALRAVPRDQGGVPTPREPAVPGRIATPAYAAQEAVPAGALPHPQPGSAGQRRRRKRRRGQNSEGA